MPILPMLDQPEYQAWLRAHCLVLQLRNLVGMLLEGVGLFAVESFSVYSLQTLNHLLLCSMAGVLKALIGYRMPCLLQCQK